MGSGSLSNLAWKKFRKNKLGVLSLFLILSIILIAFLGYLITPDQSPYANRQLLEISMQKPGFKVTMLKVRKKESINSSGWFSLMVAGHESPFMYYPIESYNFNNDSIVVKLFSSDHDGIVKTFSVADVIGNHESSEINPNNNILREQLYNNLVTKRFLFGTDQFGRDLLSRMIIGARVSISVGFISVAISLVVGILLGALAGFLGGRTDDFIMWLINVIWSIPTLLLVIAITFALGRGFWQIFIAVGLTMWVEVARVVRGQIMSLKEKEFIEAGFALGYSSFRIITRHLIPNILSPVIVISAANFASAILIEAGLSFLGIGIQPPMPSWGSMIKEYYHFIILDSAYLAIIPGVAIIITVLAFITLGNVLRDALDVKVTD